MHFRSGPGRVRLRATAFVRGGCVRPAPGRWRTAVVAGLRLRELAGDLDIRDWNAVVNGGPERPNYGR